MFVWLANQDNFLNFAYLRKFGIDEPIDADYCTAYSVNKSAVEVYMSTPKSFQEIIMSTSSFGGEKNGKKVMEILIILAPNALMDHH